MYRSILFPAFSQLFLSAACQREPGRVVNLPQQKDIPNYSLCVGTVVSNSRQTLRLLIHQLRHFADLFKDYRVVFYENGSTDESEKVLDRLSEGDSRISVHHYWHDYVNPSAPPRERLRMTMKSQCSALHKVDGSAGPDIYMLIDPSILGWDDQSLLTSFQHGEWDGICSNGLANGKVYAPESLKISDVSNALTRHAKSIKEHSPPKNSRGVNMHQAGSDYSAFHQGIQKRLPHARQAGEVMPEGAMEDPEQDPEQETEEDPEEETGSHKHPGVEVYRSWDPHESVAKKDPLPPGEVEDEDMEKFEADRHRSFARGHQAHIRVSDTPEKDTEELPHVGSKQRNELAQRQKRGPRGRKSTDAETSLDDNMSLLRAVHDTDGQESSARQKHKLPQQDDKTLRAQLRRLDDNPDLDSIFLPVNGILEVESCFGGLSFYKSHVFDEWDCKFDHSDDTNNKNTADFIPFNLCIHNHDGYLGLNPKMMVRQEGPQVYSLGGVTEDNVGKTICLSLGSSVLALGVLWKVAAMVLQYRHKQQIYREDFEQMYKI